jgi:hypothetical protein
VKTAKHALSPDKSQFYLFNQYVVGNRQIVMAIKEPRKGFGDTHARSGCNQNAGQGDCRKDGNGCQTGTGAMLKTISAIAVSAIIAACFVLSPSLSPQVAAGAPAAKTDRADSRLLGKDCSQHAWPYYEAACLRDSTNRLAPAHDVRFVALENSAHPAGISQVASR